MLGELEKVLQRATELSNSRMVAALLIAGVLGAVIWQLMTGIEMRLDRIAQLETRMLLSLQKCNIEVDIDEKELSHADSGETDSTAGG